MQAASAVKQNTTSPGKTPSVTKESAMLDAISKLLFIIFSAVGIYFGWKVGIKNGTYFWSVIQSIGTTLRSYIAQLFSSAQEYARRSR